MEKGVWYSIASKICIVEILVYGLYSKRYVHGSIFILVAMRWRWRCGVIGIGIGIVLGIDWLVDGGWWIVDCGWMDG